MLETHQTDGQMFISAICTVHIHHTGSKSFVLVLHAFSPNNVVARAEWMLLNIITHSRLFEWSSLELAGTLAEAHNASHLQNHLYPRNHRYLQTPRVQITHMYSQLHLEKKTGDLESKTAILWIIIIRFWF